jgi:sugar phosphate isomerase/epimerase
LVVGAHIHDNHGEKDEHLAPYDGSIDWEKSIKILKSAPAGDVPLLLELKEKTGPDAPGAQEQLAVARKAWDRFAEEWEG